ncbi:hypothetical protein PHISP_03465 [Aspergillus sp. HF37]|nr:hypothetical protein PHISP_03465 [Aspergillus sp. HF37]
MHFILAALVSLLPLASAHTTFTTLFVDGVNQGDGVCVRMNQDPYKAGYPVNPSSKNMACGFDGEQGVSRVCPANASSTLTFEFRIYADGAQPGAIAPSHKGPCAAYMKRVPDATEDNNAAGDGWFKIFESTYDESAGQWCTEKLIENNGHLSVKIPADIRPGYYLVRPELLALHGAALDQPDPQFYVGCAQVFVQGSGSAMPENVRIGEGTYDLSSTPGLTFNIYETPMKLPYPMFGPPVYDSSGEAEKQVHISGGGSLEKGDPIVQTIGLKPEGCILIRDNWCGFEVPSYTTEEGCWNSSENCWDQSDVCWNTAPPTGPANCNIWQKKCEELDDSCRNGDFNGPPHEGKVLTPTLPSLEREPVIFERALHGRGPSRMPGHRRVRGHGHF